MKRQFAFYGAVINAVVLLWPTISFGQKLSIKDLIHLQKADLEEVNFYLSQKGFRINDTDNDRLTNKKSVKWSHINGSNQNINSIAFVEVKENLNSGAKIVEYRIINDNTYIELKKEIGYLAMRKVKSWISDDGLYSSFAGQNYCVVASSKPIKGSKRVMYVFDILLKEDLPDTDYMKRSE